MEKSRAGSYRKTSGPLIEPEIVSRSRDDIAAQRLWIARLLADLLDRRFVIPGTSIRIGLDPILGLIPGIGDLLANLTGSMILVIAAQFKIPKIILLRMALNVAANSLIGAIPIFGDLFSIWFRSNLKNVQLLERYAADPSARSRPGDWLFVVVLVAALLAMIFAILAGLVWLAARLFQ